MNALPSRRSWFLRRWNPLRAPRWRFLRRWHPFRVLVGTLNAVGTHTRDLGENLNDVGAGHAGDAGDADVHDIKIGRQVAWALLADYVESASETTQNLSETIRL